MGHPMEGWLEDARAKTSAFWNRVNEVSKKLKHIPLSKFTADELPYLYKIMNRKLDSDGESSRKALEYLEKKVKRLKKKARARSRGPS